MNKHNVYSHHFGFDRKIFNGDKIDLSYIEELLFKQITKEQFNEYTEVLVYFDDYDTSSNSYNYQYQVIFKRKGIPVPSYKRYMLPLW